jgi:hypothetical protein
MINTNLTYGVSPLSYDRICHHCAALQRGENRKAQLTPRPFFWLIPSPRYLPKNC